MYQDLGVRQPLPKTYTCDYKEQLFIQPDRRMVTVNSDNTIPSVKLVDSNDEGQVYSNHALTGQAHPRTKIAPVITARSLDLDYWKDTPMTHLSILNKRKKQYPNLAGYNTDWYDNDVIAEPVRKTLGNQVLASPLVQTIQPGVYTLPTSYDPINNDFNIDETTDFEPVQQVRDRGNVIFTPISSKAPTPGTKPEPEPKTDAPKVESQPEKPIMSSVPGKVLPPPSGNTVEKFMPYIQSTQTHLSNAYPQQQELQNDVSIYNVFDPRFTGYGSDNRNYLEPTLNQTRYYYDDVNAIRMPNYIVRSKLDSCVTGFGDQYGPMRIDQRTLNENRPLAEQAYLDNHLAFRNDLMESLMRKKNSELWQIRKAPKYTTRQGLK
jgi:hypothetical protein